MDMSRWLTRTELLPPVLALPPLLAYPPLEWAVAGWVGLTPLLLLIKHGQGSMRSWLVGGWGFGVVFHAFQFSWVHRTMVELGGMPAPRFIAFAVGMLAFLALFSALVIAVSRWVWIGLGVSPYLAFPVLLSLQDMLLGWFPFGGVPWGSLAGTQTPSLAAQVVVPLGGGASLVLLLAVVNAGWAWAAEGCSRSPWRALGRPAVLACITLLLLQTWPVPHWDRAGRGSFSALLIPGDFTFRETTGRDSRMRGFMARTLAEHGRLERDGAQGRPPGDGPKVGLADLIVWPEGAVQGYVEAGKQLEELSLLAALLNADFLLGSDARGAGGDYNSSYLVSADRSNFKRYDKRERVPFGEYVPAGFRWIFKNKVTRGEQDYLAGNGPPVLPWQGRLIGLAICFESILPGHMRRAARDGAEVILTIANDHWLTPAARMQHLRLSALRALEIGRDLLFVSNGGWIAHVARGRVVTSSNRELRALLTRPRLRIGATPWVRWGYVPLAMLLAGMAGAGFLLRRRQGGA